MDDRMFDLDPLSYRLVTSKMSVFCSAVNSTQSSHGECFIAIGTEGKAVVIKDWEDRNGGTVLRHIPTSDKSHVLSQEFDETIYVWDLRNTRNPLLELAGQVNTHTKLNFGIDHYESILVGAGEDRYMRTWSLRTGDLLSQVAPTDASATPRTVRFMTSATEEDHPQVAAARSEALLWVANGKDLDILGTSP
ncbi:hypothetical protein HDU87_001078 [Geranomyces variabilis]|uniref:Uncharacterized protein n=1 Tax=Geranomyces variabilis TaxID=109894 RepID=A0AAD5TMX6_9FUNG|nr:hypothetical protein HDU87_001078 [Geranomyces variabilis]